MLWEPDPPPPTVQSLPHPDSWLGLKKNPLTFHRDAISSSFWLSWNTECHPNTRPLLWPRCYAAMETAAKQAGWGWCRVGGWGVPPWSSQADYWADLTGWPHGSCLICWPWAGRHSPPVTEQLLLFLNLVSSERKKNHFSQQKVKTK